jgi:hypothetical protein
MAHDDWDGFGVDAPDEGAQRRNLTTNASAAASPLLSGGASSLGSVKGGVFGMVPFGLLHGSAALSGHRQ